MWLFFWDEPFLSRLYDIYLSIKDLENLAEFNFFCKIFIYVHKNLFVPQTLNLLEKWALIFLHNLSSRTQFAKIINKKVISKN